MTTSAKPTICDLHAEIIKYTARLENLPKHYDVDEMRSDVEQIARWIYDLTVQAKAAGQSMETRLLAYRSAIEELGFERKR